MLDNTWSWQRLYKGEKMAIFQLVHIVIWNSIGSKILSLFYTTIKHGNYAMDDSFRHFYRHLVWAIGRKQSGPYKSYT